MKSFKHNRVVIGSDKIWSDPKTRSGCFKKKIYGQTHAHRTRHTAHSTPHIITHKSVNHILKSQKVTVYTNTKHTKTKKITTPNPPSRTRSKKTFSPSCNLLLPCCKFGHLLLRQRSVVMLLPCCVQPFTAASTICCRRDASRHREEIVARPAVHKLLLHAHRSAAENPVADLLLQGSSSNSTWVSPLVPYMFWILKLSWCIGIYVLHWPVFINPNWLNLTRIQYDPFLIRTDSTRFFTRSEYISDRIGL